MGVMEGIHVTSESAEVLLVIVSAAIGLVGFLAAAAWHWIWHRGEYDWAEALARSLFILLQGTLWGGVVGFIVIGAVAHVWYGQ